MSAARQRNKKEGILEKNITSKLVFLYCVGLESQGGGDNHKLHSEKNLKKCSKKRFGPRFKEETRVFDAGWSGPSKLLLVSSSSQMRHQKN